MPWLIGIAAVVVGVVVLLWLRARRRAKQGLTSLVMFLKEPRQIDAQAVRRAATKAFGVRVGATPEEENFVVQYTPETMPVRINGLPMGFICAPKKYSEAPAEAFNGFDIRIARVMTEHKAWISIDLVQPVPAALKPEVYRHMGRLMAEFVDENVLGIYCPETDQCMFNHPGLKNELRGENPLAALEMKDVPVIQASYDDPKLKETVQEALRRWPEFVQAFARRKAGQKFGVKLEFKDGEESEFMWIVVDAIEAEQVRGVLDNAPVTVKNVKSGDVVTARQADVLDWAYEDGEELVGGFSLKVLAGQK
jgi:uncharacterized protein YegJ (DUF2314 family)